MKRLTVLRPSKRDADIVKSIIDNNGDILSNSEGNSEIVTSVFIKNQWKIRDYILFLFSNRKIAQKTHPSIFHSARPNVISILEELGC